MLNKEGINEEQFLKMYDVTKFDRPSVTVDDLLFAIEEIKSKDIRKLSEKKLQVMLLKRTNHPYINTWCLPGVFVKMDESLEQASLRALKEKTEFSDIYLEQLYTFGENARDKRTRVISVSYLALIDKNKSKIKETSDQEETRWFDIRIKELHTKKEKTKEGIKKISRFQIFLYNANEILENEIEVIESTFDNLGGIMVNIIKSDNIGFDHLKIIYHGIIRIRNKIEYSDIAFNLLPNKFTFAELQLVYEIILGKKFTKANFQRKISNKVKELDEYRSGGFRPARLYVYNPNK